MTEVISESSDQAHADYIAMMHPPVALALADWLDAEADLHDMHHDVYGVGDQIAALTDAVLGGEQR